MMPNDDAFTTWISTLDDAPVAIVYLCGELDTAGVTLLLADLKEVINGSRSILFDAHLLSYIDATGLSALSSVQKALKDTGRGACIVGAHGLLERILVLSGAEGVFKRYETADEAIAEVGNPGW